MKHFVFVFLLLSSSLAANYALAGAYVEENYDKCDEVSQLLDLCEVEEDTITSAEDTYTDEVIVNIHQTVQDSNMTDEEKKLFLRKLLAYATGQITNPSTVNQTSELISYYPYDDGGYSATINTADGDGVLYEVNVYKNKKFVAIPTFGIRSKKTGE